MLLCVKSLTPRRKEPKSWQENQRLRWFITGSLTHSPFLKIPTRFSKYLKQRAFHLKSPGRSLRPRRRRLDT